MPEIQGGVRELLEEWTACAAAMEAAAKAKDFDLMSKKFREGRSFFQRLGRLVRADKDSLKGERQALDAGVKRWQEVVSLLPGWMSETKQELESVRKRRTVKSKLSSAYERSASKKTGVKLYVKAR